MSETYSRRVTLLEVQGSRKRPQNLFDCNQYGCNLPNPTAGQNDCKLGLLRSTPKTEVLVDWKAKIEIDLSDYAYFYDAKQAQMTDYLTTLRPLTNSFLRVVCFKTIG